jgi:hypothetical protein
MMMHNPQDETEQALSAELRQLSDRAGDGDVDPAADLARAQRSVRRSRLRAAGGLVLGTVAVIVAAQFVGPVIGGSVTGGPNPSVMAQPNPPANPKPTPVREPAAKPPAWSYNCKDQPTRVPAGEGKKKAAPPRRNAAEKKLLGRYNDAVAEQVDPRHEHLEKGSSNWQRWLECKDGREVRRSMGSKFGWTDGSGGGGQVAVTVGTDLTAVADERLNCGDVWSCRKADVSHEDVKSAQVATFDGGFAVIVERTDGTAVVVIADQAFGNNYQDPIDGFPFDTDDLIKVAVDPRLNLKL